ncbi:unnamed protein product [Parascedosporium putredinis]|uniref:Elongation of fatty acids protein n=1 Tax=Parascedosporium putredinis TaxID=1442378 RepID=A0A9P1ME25_9PEZI|nr:unnamed protein product [Parascedosporium putredinis]CAI8003817.1 unnamed protein product [Parascedosporium putredinis]
MSLASSSSRRRRWTPRAATFTIPQNIFDAALDPRVPITIAAVYAVTVKALNVYNTSNGKKPWAIAKTTGFAWFVILHNVFLAVYSAWTFVGMFRTLKVSVQNPFGPAGLAGTVDSLCHILTQSPAITSAGVPDVHAPGRIWNEGLAFYGWIFYLSKFYEVLDTFIILAKGKQSSTLQTYHHAGAMMCMWAGIRYMAAPIWMFAFVNSFIHAMMYTYYTVTAFSIRVPMIIKRSLTTMQITQFLVGASYAMAHSFVSYVVPVTNVITESVTEAAAAAAASSSVAAAADAEAPVAEGLADTLKALFFGAAAKVSEAAAATTYVEQRCITTDGSTFAIWLNVLYLAPLTYLFVKFFIESYLRRGRADAVRAKGKSNGSAAQRRMSNVERAEKAGWDAAKEVNREVYGDGNGSEEAIEDDEVVVPSPKPKSRTRASRRA